MSRLHRIIVRPVVTEKTSAAQQERGEYTFRVHTKATKPAIKSAIEKLFGVTVVGVWTSTQRGKPRAVGGYAGVRPNWKKAIVRLKSGDTIEHVFEGS
jgi:large subunit ribosomal protein L23